jgi:hypothetical protein
MLKRIFLDLDGVVRDWVDGIKKLYEVDFSPEHVNDWGWLTSFVCSYHKISEQEFWEKQDEKFWLGLQFTEDAKRILSLVEQSQCKVCLLTSPTLNNAGWSQQWIRENMPTYFQEKRYLIGPAKYMCAHEDSLLIDDAEKNVNDWFDYGGLAFLYPAPWNASNGLSHIAVETLEEVLDEYKVL